jgi:hypothetical protein
MTTIAKYEYRCSEGAREHLNDALMMLWLPDETVEPRRVNLHDIARHGARQALDAIVDLLDSRTGTIPVNAEDLVRDMYHMLGD